MKKNVMLFLCGVTLLLVGMVAYQAVMKPKSDKLQETTRSMIMTYADVRTRPVGLEEYVKSAKEHSETNLQDVAASEREKLFSRIEQFHKCYTSGNFSDYKQFRLSSKYKVGSGMAALVRQTAGSAMETLKSDEEVLQFAWEHFNSTNKITAFDPDSIKVSIVTRRDLSPEWRMPSNVLGFTNTAMRCWDGAVKYDRSVEDILRVNHAFRLAVVDQFARFNSADIGPATPLRLAFVWDSETQDWLPVALCTTVKVGDYNTIF